jgi:uncharacterized tellurite resistance protein B-like protein
MDIERIELFRAIAEMAYVIAKADRGLSAQERMAFHKIVEEELEFESWAAQSRFELLDEVTQPTIEVAYNEAIHDFKKYKKHLTSDLKKKAIIVLEKVAEACSGFSEHEVLILEKFKSDLSNL